MKPDNKTCPYCIYYIPTKTDRGICNYLGFIVLANKDCRVKPNKFKRNKKMREFREVG